MSANRFSRVHALICFSRRIAFIGPYTTSKYTSRLLRYRVANPGVSLLRCSYIRRSMLFVTPVYSVRERLARI